MKRIQQTIVAVLFVGVLILTLGVPVRAQTPHFPTEDTYTDLNNPTLTHGGDVYLTLSGTYNGVTCTEVTYLWYKFSVPNATINQATFYLEYEPFPAPNPNPIAVELRSSSNTTWDQATLNWGNQPALDAQVLATSPNVARGGTVAFTSPEFITYLNAHRGTTVSLVVRADCDGVVGFPGSRSVAALPTAGASMIMYDPTAVELIDLSASTQSAPTLALVAALVAVPTLAWMGKRLIRRRKQ